MGRCGSPCTRATPSGGSSPTMWPATSGTGPSTPPDLGMRRANAAPYCPGRTTTTGEPVHAISGTKDKARTGDAFPPLELAATSDQLVTVPDPTGDYVHLQL